jgi:hypothetical protein
VSVEAPRYKLYSALKSLRASWEQAQDRWQDAVRHEFEEQFWNALEPAVLSALSALDRLGQVLRDARRDCE